MNPLARDTLKRLQREAGAQLDPVDDYELIREFVDLARETWEADATPGMRAAKDPCRQIGNVLVWRLSIGARSFFDEQVHPLYGDTAMGDLAFVWVMAHSRDPETLWQLRGDPKGIRRAIKKWKRTVAVPADVLFSQVEEFQRITETLEDQDGPEEERPVPDFTEAMRGLTKETGRSIEELTWNTPEEEINMMLMGGEEQAQYGSRNRARLAFRKKQAEIKALLQTRAENATDE